MRAVLVVAVVATVPLTCCTCQRPENVAAKERLSAPPPKDPTAALAQQKLDAQSLHKSDAARDRANNMRAEEIRARIGGYKLDTKANLTFSRGTWKMAAKEKLHVEQAPEGDFSVRVETGAGGLQELVYANDVLFLKNNNGKWRASRDPRGERTEYLNKSVGVWRSFYALLDHAMILEPVGSRQYSGRSAYEYTIRLPDQSAEAKTLGRTDPMPELGMDSDAGPALTTRDVQKRVTERLSGWRKRSKPAGGSGNLVVDNETGVVLYVRFDGRMVVGDQPEGAKLKVKLEQKMSEVGTAPRVLVPKKAIDEVVRKKWPVDPYGKLEEKKLLPERPKDTKSDDKKTEKKSEG